MSTYVPKPNNPTRPDLANVNRIAFMESLDEIGDRDLREQIYSMIEELSKVFMKMSNLGQYAAQNQASEFIAACVWNKAKG